MKKILIIAMVLIGSIAFAQQKKSDFQKDTEKLVSITNKNTFGVLAEQFKALVAEDKQEDFIKEVEKTLPSLYSKIAQIYMEEFTHEEIKELLKFYETPIGEKMVSKTGIITKKSMKAGQEWGIGLQDIMQKYR